MAPVRISSARSTVIQGLFTAGRPRISAMVLPSAPTQPRMAGPQPVQPRVAHPHTVLSQLARPGAPPPRVAQQQPGPARPGVPQTTSPLAHQQRMAQPNVVQPRGVHPQVVQPQTAPPQGLAVQRIGNGEAFQLPANLSSFGGEGGQPLPTSVRQKMESFFGTSFADVRVHIGSQAPSIGALAFTHGSDLYFAPGQYNPDTVEGQKLLGHELTHVVQQRAGRVRNPFGSGIAVVQDPGMETEAERLGLRAATSQVPLQAKLASSVPIITAKAATSSYPAHNMGRQAAPAIQPQFAIQSRQQSLVTSPAATRLATHPHRPGIIQLAARKKHKVEIGHREGWPGTLMAKIVTHAVYQVDGNPPKGYGKDGGVGKIAPDGVKGAKYQWFPVYLTLTDRQLGIFEKAVREEAAKVRYTGVGANCYTPIYLALYKLLSEPTIGANSKHYIKELIKLTESSNQGMGTFWSNNRIAANAVISAGKWYMGWDYGLSTMKWGVSSLSGHLGGGALGYMSDKLRVGGEVIAHVLWLYFLYETAIISQKEFYKRLIALLPIYAAVSLLREKGYHTVADALTYADVGMRFV
jgi:hypothetical protein